MRQKPVRYAVIHPMKLATLVLLLAGLCFLTACKTISPPPAPTGDSTVAIQEGVPGGVFVNTVEVWAEVTAIDTANRRMTLLLQDGENTTVTVGPEAVNFDQIWVGDFITTTLTEETVVYLDEEGASIPDGGATMVVLAPKGFQPGGLVAKTARVTATIWAIDMAKRTVTLRFEDFNNKTYPVRPDIDLSKRKTGDKVVFLITEMIAISVEKP